LHLSGLHNRVAWLFLLYIVWDRKVNAHVYGRNIYENYGNIMSWKVYEILFVSLKPQQPEIEITYDTLLFDSRMNE
jgi:hypothetical protein